MSELAQDRPQTPPHSPFGYADFEACDDPERHYDEDLTAAGRCIGEADYGPDLNTLPTDFDDSVKTLLAWYIPDSDRDTAENADMVMRSVITGDTLSTNEHSVATGLISAAGHGLFRESVRKNKPPTSQNIGGQNASAHNSNQPPLIVLANSFKNLEEAIVQLQSQNIDSAQAQDARSQTMDRVRSLFPVRFPEGIKSGKKPAARDYPAQVAIIEKDMDSNQNAHSGTMHVIRALSRAIHQSLAEVDARFSLERHAGATPSPRTRTTPLAIYSSDILASEAERLSADPGIDAKLLSAIQAAVHTRVKERKAASRSKGTETEKERLGYERALDPQEREKDLSELMVRFAQLGQYQFKQGELPSEDAPHPVLHFIAHGTADTSNPIHKDMTGSERQSQAIKDLVEKSATFDSTGLTQDFLKHIATEDKRESFIRAFGRPAWDRMQAYLQDAELSSSRIRSLLRRRQPKRD